MKNEPKIKKTLSAIKQLDSTINTPVSLLLQSDSLNIKELNMIKRFAIKVLTNRMNVLLPSERIYKNSFNTHLKNY